MNNTMELHFEALIMWVQFVMHCGFSVVNG